MRKLASLLKVFCSVTLCCDYLTVFLFNESLPGVCSRSSNPSWPYKDESQGQIAISLKRAWNRYKQQSAKVWPRIVQGIDWWINTLNCFSWARLHLSSIKHSSIFSPCLHWWQRLIRKHLSMLTVSKRNRQHSHPVGAAISSLLSIFLHICNVCRFITS